jgi:hypothetical protein
MKVENPSMSEFKRYRKIATQLLRPYIPGEDLTGISVSDQDVPGPGGMVAINEDNLKDQWYVAKSFFEGKYELVEELPMKVENLIDITYTVKASVGRRLMKNVVTGEEFWVSDESDSAEQPLPKKGGKRREKKIEI